MSSSRSQLLWSCASVLGCAHALGLVGCNGKATEEAYGQSEDDLRRRGSRTAALRSGVSCDSLLEQFQENLLLQVRERAEQYRRGGDPYYGPFYADPVENPLLAGASPDVDLAPAPASEALSANGSAAGFSETTVQVPGVDEADFVKADGDRIYLLHGSALYVLRAWPANATEILAAVPIEGEAADLFVHDGKVAVFSRHYGGLPGADQSTYPYYYYYYPTYTKLTVLDVQGDAPEVLREAYVEGSYVSSRRHDGVVRAILQQSSKAQLDYPSVNYVDFLGHPYSQKEIDAQVDLWVALASDTIFDSVIEDYLPSEYERVDGRLVKQPLRCGDYWLPGPGLTQAGASSVVTLDLGEVDEPLRHVTVLGPADGVYANQDVVLISQTDYRYYTGAIEQLQTNLHRFEIDGVDTTYAASGTFTGYLQSQFSLDERDGVIRLATTETSWNVLPVEGDVVVASPSGPVSRVLTLGKRGNRLVELGRTADFGAEEQIYATRFFGDRAYVVTFRQVDPLFVVDLGDPEAPRVVGELHIPGFSNFLYPLPDHHLLAIGQDADERGATLGLALQLFDVREPAAPRLAHKYAFTEQGGSDANIDHRAISFHPEQNVVAFPYQNYLTGESTLEVFRFSSEDGFERVGGIAPGGSDLTLEECLVVLGYPQDPAFLEQLSLDPTFSEYLLRDCRYYGQGRFRRGLFRDDEVLAISTRRVAAYALDALEGPPLGEAELPPEYYYGYGGVIAPGMGGSGGSAGAAGSSGTPPDGAGGSSMAGAGGAPSE